jgi:hypothetical protein
MSFDLSGRIAVAIKRICFSRISSGKVDLEVQAIDLIVELRESALARQDALS